MWFTWNVRSRCESRADGMTVASVIYKSSRSGRCPIPVHRASFQSSFTLSGILFTHANHGASGVNAMTTSDQSRHMDANPVCLKTSPRSFCVTMAATVSRGGVSPVGVWLVASEPKDSKSYEACLKETTVQAAVIPFRVTVCKRAELKKLSIQ